MLNMKWKSFNLNQDIRVKLNELGYQRMADLHNEYVGIITKWEKRDANFFRRKADSKGYTKFHMWEFMQNFGVVTGMGMDIYYDVTILIDDTERI
jgi:hypothetical protein